jgi:dTDP-4-amino-4,6-dideoxygalactose transaminase
MIPLFKVSMSSDVLEPVNKVLMSGYVGQGEQVEEFEKLLRNHFGVPFVNTLNSGTSAIQLAVRCLKTHNDHDEILTTPLTCTATNWAILANGVKLKWVDVDPETCNLDLTDLERKLTANTIGVMVVHWGGYPVDLDRLREIQNRFYKQYGFRFRIIEDCAHAWGSIYKGKLIGNHGHLCAFSFQAIKHFTTVDGGCLVSPNEADHKKVKLLRWYGIDREQKTKDFRCESDIGTWGGKYHMNDVNATIGIHNYPHVHNIVNRHKSNAAFYNENLKKIAGVTLLKNEEGFDSSYWIYTMKVKRRDDFVDKMKEEGIMVSRVHERNDKHTCVAQYRSFLPSLDSLSKEMVCIPVGCWVTDEDREKIVTSIKKGW